MKRESYSIIYALHVLPEEIYDLGRIIRDFELVSLNNQNVNNTLYIDLNISDEYYDWESSKLTKEVVIDIFNNFLEISKKTLNIISNIRSEGEWGVNSTRRLVIREFKYDYDYIGYIDVDIVFNPESVSYVYETLEKVEGEYLIFSAMLAKLWNSHFDELTHPKYRNIKDRHYFKKLNPLTQNNLYKTQKNRIGFIDDVIIGGGWFNIFSSNIFDFIDIPDELGVYGLDDHWVQECCRFLNKNGWNIKQCYNEKFVVFENQGRKFNFNDTILSDNDKLGKKYKYQASAKTVYNELYDKFIQTTIKKYF